MRQFDLPILKTSASPEQALEAMVPHHVSGIVIADGNKYRLLHYFQVRAAWRAKQSLSQIEDYAELEDRTQGNASFASSMANYWIESAQRQLRVVGPYQTEFVTLWSAHEPFAETYFVSSPGYCCDDPQMHCYPPHTPQPDKSCEVPFCPGHTP